ncbi:DNA polymerase III subunit epsilon [Oerskovia turbata]|uniref:DNA polymerase III subunit epsilon n=1 Tax=Oerskovia turbata TaxID=1713 RepID=A0A4Q1KKV8_9CELL|nr:exonuclease domain-containing protein [Oerskovia turbata]RXR27394.1 DNA polymerase III subunit epsilon [Oerskovia turbata]RXR30055.1 DNA polymerase III subunit epsilon [Oerskovia turbata]TGJ95027.1 DNA polymerase III subunit epsilon [Actinotalea fermentans ATCC 43279 = JCM 9966 = DSM 3133]
MSWTTGPLLGFDTETTGVDVTNDRIVTAALVRRVPGRSTEVRTWLVDPGVPIPAEAAAIHGISTEHAVTHGVAPGPALEEIASLIAADLAIGVPVVAFNAAFDLSLLDAELARHALPTLGERLGGEVTPVIDPLVLDRSLDRFRKGKRKLGDLCAHYGVTDGGNLHTADVDVLATLDVLEAMTRVFPELAEQDLGSLHRHQITAHRAWAENFNTWRAGQGYVGAGASTAWPS